MTDAERTSPAATRRSFREHDLVVTCPTDGVTYRVVVTWPTFACPGCGKVGHA